MPTQRGGHGTRQVRIPIADGFQPRQGRQLLARREPLDMSRIETHKPRQGRQRLSPLTGLVAECEVPSHGLTPVANNCRP